MAFWAPDHRDPAGLESARTDRDGAEDAHATVGSVCLPAHLSAFSMLFYTCTSSYIHIYIYNYVYTCTYIYVYICLLSISIHIYTHMYICIHICLDIYGERERERVRVYIAYTLCAGVHAEMYIRVHECWHVHVSARTV